MYFGVGAEHGSGRSYARVSIDIDEKKTVNNIVYFQKY
jgi:hypothetical protein